MNMGQMVNDKGREFKEEVRQMIDSHLEDRIEEYSAKRRKTEPESMKERKETSVAVVPSLAVVSEEKEESEMSSTLKAPMEASPDVLSALGDHVSTSGSFMSIPPKPGSRLEFGSTEYSHENDISLEDREKYTKYFEDYVYETHGNKNENRKVFESKCLGTEDTKSVIEQHFFVFYKREDKFVVDLDVLCHVAVSLPKCKFVCDNKSSYDGKTLEELFFKNKDRYSTFLFVEFVMERLTTKFEPPDFLLQFFVILHLEKVYSKYKLCAKFVFHELFDVYFEKDFFDKIFDMLLPKSKYGTEQNGVANFWKDVCKPLCDKEYKSMFFCKNLYEQKFREDFFSRKNPQNPEEPCVSQEASSSVSPESQFVPLESLENISK